jgi:hypothetical protein
MSSIAQIGKVFKLMDITATHEKLPLGVYSVNFDQMSGEYFLIQQTDFILPKKIYGKHDIIYRWLESYKHNSSKNMGIILAGVKGGGKTITAQKFCIEAQKPVLLITEPFEGSGFLNFLTDSRLSESIIFIDEFEKVYDSDNYHERSKSRDLLQLMDGTFQTKLIFLLTVNTFKLSDYFVNRLNRIKYRKDYIDLPQDIIDEVVEDLLLNKAHKESITTFFQKINMCTFDLLVNVIKEMNLFNEDALEVGKHLNLRSEPKRYSVYELYEGKEHKCSDINMSPDVKTINIGREDTAYLPKEYEDTYSIHVKLVEAEIIRVDTTSFILKYEGLRFKFTEALSISLLF